MDNPAKVNEESPGVGKESFVKRESDANGSPFASKQEETSPQKDEKEDGGETLGFVTDRGWLVASLALALFLYLTMWLCNDVWYFVVPDQTATATVTPTLTLTPSPLASPSATTTTPTATPTFTPTPRATSRASSISPPVMFCNGMFCGVIIMFLIASACVLILPIPSWRISQRLIRWRKSRRQKSQPDNDSTNGASPA